MYHERFNNLHSRSIELVDNACPRMWNVDEDEALFELQELATELAGVYGISTPVVQYGRRPVYYRDDMVIVVDKPSMVSFLHEFRHHMQNHGMQANQDREEDARGWSISLFAEAEPEYFERAWEDDRILFMPEVDA